MHTWRPPVALRNGNPPGLGKGTPQRSRHPCGIPHCPIAMPLVASQAPRWKKRRAAPRARPPLPQREHGGTNTPNRPARLSRPALGWWPNDLDARESLLAFFEVIGTGEKCSAPSPAPGRRRLPSRCCASQLLANIGRRQRLTPPRPLPGDGPHRVEARSRLDKKSLGAAPKERAVGPFELQVRVPRQCSLTGKWGQTSPMRIARLPHVHLLDHLVL